MQTKIIGGGTAGAIVAGVEQAVDPQFLAARVSLRPLDYTGAGRVLGHYRTAFSTTAAAPAANSVLAALRWTDTGSFLVLNRILVGVTVVTAVTAQRQDPIVATVGRAYTVAQTTNATVISLAGNNNKMRTAPMSASLASLLAASAAAGLTGGTRVLDGNPFGQAALSPALIGVGTGVPNQELYAWEAFGMHPIVLGANEGVELAWGPTALATGTVTVNITLAWAEVVVF
jgi:hypothetical protein